MTTTVTFTPKTNDELARMNVHVNPAYFMLVEASTEPFPAALAAFTRMVCILSKSYSVTYTAMEQRPISSGRLASDLPDAVHQSNVADEAWCNVALEDGRSPNQAWVQGVATEGDCEATFSALAACKAFRMVDNSKCYLFVTPETTSVPGAPPTR